MKVKYVRTLAATIAALSPFVFVGLWSLSIRDPRILDPSTWYPALPGVLALYETVVFVFFGFVFLDLD